ncbi:MAG: NUDIX domain-containing protein [Prolixibacteraceae bacterium]|nr:NUDIX domain-containing protein [Prolixibacteraceae bacterium]
MYKVFLNDRIIAIASREELGVEYSDYKIFEINSHDELISRVNHFLKRPENTCLLNENSEEIFTDDFKSRFINIQAAGGVVLHNDQILFIFRRGCWDLPKGKINRGESPEEAAIREVNEETGLGNLKIIKQIPSTWHIYLSPYKENRGKWILKETFWFEMEHSGTEMPKPQLEEDITKAEWISKDKLQPNLENTYSNLKQIISFYR